MQFEPIGYQWLKCQYGLPDLPGSIRFRVGQEYGRTGDTRVTLRNWPKNYWPGSEMADHLQFALRHEGIHLPLLWHLFRQIRVDDLADSIKRTPSGKYIRMAGFLFEFLTRQALDLGVRTSGGYVPVLDDKHYVCSQHRANARWRIYDNLLGTPAFCPMIERKPELAKHLSWSPARSLENLKGCYGQSLYSGVVARLRALESGSAENAESRRTNLQYPERFLCSLRSVGRRSISEVLSLDSLVNLQRFILDPAADTQLGLRDKQSYIALNAGDERPTVIYPCPPPALASELLKALPDVTLRSDGLHAVVRAAVIAFSFVYIHPFEDGNVRISRYLIHDSYARDGLAPKGLILPISVVIANRARDYTEVLEHHSRPVLELAKYTFDPRTRSIQLHNAEELEPLFRYPDLTRQTMFLMEATRESECIVLKQELDFLARLERAQHALRETLDLPNHRLTRLLAAIHRHGGGRPSDDTRDVEFSTLTNEEWVEAERCYRAAFAMSGAYDEE